MNGAELIAAERVRQVAAEGYAPDHDDDHDLGELTAAALCYLDAYLPSLMDEAPELPVPQAWPWEAEAWKPAGLDDPVRDLVRAGALIAAEIDRLQRRDGSVLPTGDRT